MSLIFGLFRSNPWTNEKVPHGSPYNDMVDYTTTCQMTWQVDREEGMMWH
jgi:hypothetical protein